MEISIVLSSLGTGGGLFVYGSCLYRKNERKQKTIYSDLDKEKERLKNFSFFVIAI